LLWQRSLLGVALALLLPGTPGRTAGVMAFTDRPGWMDAVMAVAALVILGWLVLVNWKIGRWR
jgi:hypothetical protein